MNGDKCFACGRKLGKIPAQAITEDYAQAVFVGLNCFKLIKAAGSRGYQPPLGGPKLYTRSSRIKGVG